MLGRRLNLQVIDADLDLTDNADTLKAVVDVYREKTHEELDAEDRQAGAPAKKKPTARKTIKIDHAEGRRPRRGRSTALRPKVDEPAARRAPEAGVGTEARSGADSSGGATTAPAPKAQPG